MRNFSLLILISFFVFACSSGDKQPADTNFSVKGVLENTAGQTVYLEEVGMGKAVPIDSTVVGEDGKFTLYGKTEDPNIFLLRINDGAFNYLLIEKDEKVIVTGDAQTLAKEIHVAGSTGSQHLADLNMRLSRLQIAIDSLTQIRNQIYQDPDKKDELSEITSKANALVAAHKEFLFSFIKENPSSLASIAALYQQMGRQKLITPNESMATFKMVDSALMANYPNSIHVKNFHSNVGKMGNEIRQQAMAESKKLLDVGSMAPDISLPSPGGQVYTLSSLRGKYVLLDFWAAWCGPCRRENPTLVANYAKFNKKGFEIFQVSLDKTQKAWEDAIIADKLSWPYHVSDLQYWSSAPARLYNVSSIPANYLLDPDGKIVAKDLRGPAVSAKLAEIFR